MQKLKPKAVDEGWSFASGPLEATTQVIIELTMIFPGKLRV
jgi:hypothetical protein